jgi:hypothetical protein
MPSAIMRILPILIIIIALILSCEETGTEEKPNLAVDPIKFFRLYGGTERDIGYSVLSTEDNGYVAAGVTKSFGAGESDAWLIKTDSLGNLIWTRTYGYSGGDHVWDISATADGGFIMTGLVKMNDDYQLWLIKIDKDGVEDWNRSFGGSGTQWGRCVKQTFDNGYIVAGHSDSLDNANTKGFIVKTDYQGNEEWSKIFTTTGDSPIFTVEQTIDGNFVFAGQIEVSTGIGRTGWMVKVDQAGNQLWSQEIGDSFSGMFYSMQNSFDGGYILVGQVRAESESETDVWLVKTDEGGQMLWSKTFGGIGTDQARSITHTHDGGYIIAGNTSSLGSGSSDFLLIKVGINGDEEWLSAIGTSSMETGYSVKQTSDLGYILSGRTNLFSNGHGDLCLIKTDSLGNTVEIDSLRLPQNNY